MCNSNSVIASTNKGDAPKLSNKFNSVYILINCVKQPVTTQITVADLAQYTGLVTLGSPQAILSLPLGTELAGFFSLSKSPVPVSTVIPKLDFGQISYYVKLNDQSCDKINVRVPFLEMVQNLAKTIEGDLGFATAFLKLNIPTGRDIVDANTGKHIIIERSISKLLLNNIGIPQGLEPIELATDGLPLTIQLFVFKTLNIGDIIPSGKFIIGFALVTDYTGMTSSYSVNIDRSTGQIIGEFGESSFQATFIPYQNKCPYWVLKYTPPVISTNLRLFESSIIPQKPIISGVIRNTNTITIVGNNLALADRVLVGLQTATILSASQNQIVVERPPGSTDEPVTVQALGGTSTENEFVVTEILPTFGVSSGSLTSFNTSVFIKGTGFSDITSVAFNDGIISIPAQSFTINTDQTIINAITPGNLDSSKTYTIIITRGSETVSASQAFTLRSFNSSLAEIEPDIGPTTGGAQVVIQLNVGGVTSVSRVFINNKDGSIVSTSLIGFFTYATVITPENPSGNYDVIVRLSTSHGTILFKIDNPYQYQEL